MSSIKTTIRRLICTAGIVFTGLALAGGTAGASSSKSVVCTARAQDCLTAADFRALTIRSLALNRLYGLGE
ncbi:MAG: hypothetical protein ACJ75P_07130 [Gaiellaceae bacterium]